MDHPVDLMYTREHCWILLEDDTAYIGITDFAQNELGEILFVELPEAGAWFDQGDVFAEVESARTTWEFPCPLSGEVLEVNSDLDDAPENINEDPYENWIIKLIVDDPEETEDLIDADQYEACLEE